MLLPLTFSNFLNSNNPSILWSLRLLLLKTSASAFYCLQICKKIARQFKLLFILYFYRFIIIFNLALQKCFLLLNWTKLDIFIHKCPHLKMCNQNSLWRKSIRPSSFALNILYFSQGNFTNWKHSITIFWRYLPKEIFAKKQ